MLFIIHYSLRHICLHEQNDQFVGSFPLRLKIFMRHWDFMVMEECLIFFTADRRQTAN